MALNFYRYKTFVTFNSVTFEIFLKIMESVGDDAIANKPDSRPLLFVSTSTNNSIDVCTFCSRDTYT